MLLYKHNLNEACGVQSNQKAVSFVHLLTLLSGVFVLLSLSLAFFLSPVVFAEVMASTDNIAITVPTSCTFSDGFSDHTYTTTMVANSYNSNVGTSNLTIFCNDNSGFSLYAVGYSGNTYGNTTMISSDPNVPNIITGTATSGNTSDWSMKLSAVAGDYRPTITGENQGDTENFTGYHNIPTIYTKVATSPSVTDRATGSNLQITYAVYISSSQLAGTFTGKVKYTLVHPDDETPKDGPQDCPANKICYNPAVNGVVDTMGDQSLAASSTLWASNFQRPSYGFVGWSDKYDWVLNENDASGNGTGANAGYHIYGPNQTLSLTTSDYTTNGLALYAVWAEPQGNFQTWTCPDDTTMPIGTVTALTDLRDNQAYAVAKLADSNCWMIENLRLDNQYTTGQNQNNPNVTNASLSQGYGESFIGLAGPETSGFSASGEANSLYSHDGANGTVIVAGTYYTYRFPRYNNQNTNSPVVNMTYNNSNIYSYGNYYAWTAAKANIAVFRQVDASNNTLTSICPSGWELPIGAQSTVNKSFGFLSVALGGPADGANADDNSTPTGSVMSAKFREYPTNLIYSGRFSQSSFDGRGAAGYYWSAASTNEYSSAYNLSIGAYLRPGTNSNIKPYGSSIRCVAGS